MLDTHECTSCIHNHLHSTVSHIMETPSPNKPDAKREDKDKAKVEDKSTGQPGGPSHNHMMMRMMGIWIPLRTIEAVDMSHSSNQG